MSKLRQIFYGRAKKGKLEFYNKAGFRDCVQKLEGYDFELTLGKYRDKRTNSQNRFLWGVVYEVLSEHTGYMPEEIHEFCKIAFLVPKVVKVGKRKIEVPRSTTELSTDSFENYIEKIRIWAATELECTIPTPGEYEGEEITYF